MIQRRKKKHCTKFQEIAKNTCNPALYYKIVNQLKDTEKPDKFDIMLMRPEKQVPQVAKELADFFRRITDRFPPLQNDQIPNDDQHEKMKLTREQGLKRIKDNKKPKSMVYGDIFPSLVNPYAEIIVDPLLQIYNACLEKETWPLIWRTETVVVIPKKGSC